MWQHIELSDVSLGTRQRYNLVVDGNVNALTCCISESLFHVVHVLHCSSETGLGPAASHMSEYGGQNGLHPRLQNRLMLQKAVAQPSGDEDEVCQTLCAQCCPL